MSGNPTIRSGADAWVEENHPSTSHAATVNLQVGQPANQHAQAFIYFHQPAPRGATIKEAVLRFYTRNAWGPGNHTLHLTRIAQQWNHGRVTWNNRPGVTGTVINHTQTANAAFTLWEIDVTRHVQTMANGAANFGWRIHSDDTVRQQIVSLNAGSHKPTLQVIWSDAPQTPTNLVPSGGQAVSISNPVLQFDYVDIAGGDDVLAVHVQIAGDATTGPVWQHPPAGNIHWDSGPVPADEAELDLAEPVPSPALGPATYAGLSPDMTRYWRVRVQASSGLWSRWSARADGVGARMVRRTKGNLLLLSPTGGRVDDFTPAVGWEFTGRDMKHWRITIVDPDDPTTEFWASGIRKGTLDNQNRFWFTLPDTAITEWGRQYRIRVDVWDWQDRVKTPGDPPWVRVVHDFTLIHTPGVAPPTNLTGSSDPDGMPYLHLSWRRTNTPDGWRILRGNKVIRKFAGPDLMSGTPGLYRWTDRDATPNRTHTWKVQAVELNPDPNHEGQNSTAATWTGQIHTDHAWLVDWDAQPERIVAILDPDVTFEMPDTSATYEPIASDRVIRVTATQRGMQGSVAGRLIGFEDRGGRTLEQWKENFVWMKAHPARDYQLMTGNQSWRVHIGDAVLSPMRIPGSQAVDVSFSFWSLDGPPRP